MMKTVMIVALGLTLLSSPAFAAKAARHCVDKDNKEISVTAAAGKTLAAQCKAAGGKWVKVKAATTTTTKTKTKTK
jgi:opacity protein-like surface antigen